MRWREGSIVRRLGVTVVAVGIATGLLGAAALRSVERDRLLDDAALRTVSAADRAAARVDGRAAVLRAQIELLASRPAIVEATSDAESELAVALRVSDDLDELVLFDVDGRPVAASSSRRLLTVSEVPRWSDVTAGLEAGPVARIVSTERGPDLEVRARVEDPPGTAVGALVGRAPVSLLHEEAELPLLGSRTTSFLVADDGRIVAHRELDRVLGGDTFDVAGAFPSGRRTALLDLDGTRTLAAVARPNDIPVSVVVTQPEADAVAPLQTSTSSLTLLYLGVVAAIVVAVVLLARGFLRPLAGVTDAVDRLGRGDRTARVQPGGSGEVSVLADGFNRMADRLQEHQEELEQAERAVRSSEERLRMMVEGVEDYALVLLDPDGRVRSWNPGATRLLGVPAEEATGEPLTRFFDPDEPPGDVLSAAAARGSGETEGWCRRGDDGRFWARIVGRVLREADTVTGYALVLHDMTDRHRARQATEEALRQQREAAEELRRAGELKDDFLAIAAHELRTPLTAILGSSQVLTQDWDRLDEEDRTRFCDVIERHAEDMRLIVDRLLDFSRLQAGKVRLRPEPCILPDELDGHVADLARHLARHRVVVAAAADEVVIDRALLRHVVVNLLSNAAKFSESGTTVELRGELVDETLVVEVADDGIGIPPEDHDRIFEIFGQSPNDLPTARGAGVGLAIVRRYLELAGGTVTVRSAQGEGSTFTVRIPVSTAATAAAPPA